MKARVFEEVEAKSTRDKRKFPRMHGIIRVCTGELHIELAVSFPGRHWRIYHPGGRYSKAELDFTRAKPCDETCFVIDVPHEIVKQAQEYVKRHRRKSHS